MWAKIRKKRLKAFLLLGVADYLDIDIAEATQFITDGGNDVSSVIVHTVVGSCERIGYFLFFTNPVSSTDSMPEPFPICGASSFWYVS